MGLLWVNVQNRGKKWEGRGPGRRAHSAPRFCTSFHSRVSNTHTFQWMPRRPLTSLPTWVHRRLDYLVMSLLGPVLGPSPTQKHCKPPGHKNLKDGLMGGAVRGTRRLQSLPRNKTFLDLGSWPWASSDNSTSSGQIKLQKYPLLLEEAAVA